MTGNSFRLWWRAVRPFSFPASMVPAFLGMVLAWSEGNMFKHWLAFLTLVGVVTAHTGANLMSDYFDFRRGIDREGTLGGSGVLVEGLLSPKSILIASLFSFLVAGIVAHLIMLDAGFKVVWLVMGGLVAGVFYSLPPFGFKYGAMGEFVVFLAFGVGITVGSYVVQTGCYSWNPVWYSLPFGLLVSAILHANNIRDMESDVEAGVRTLAGMVGINRARFIYGAMVFFAYSLLIFFVLHGEMVPGSLAVLITLPLAWNLVFKVWRVPFISAEELSNVDAKTAQLGLAFGASMIIGIIIWTILLVVYDT